jgi:hypothetical protein
METVHLLFVGAFAASIVQAALRRDPVWMLALAVPLLFCADRAGLPVTLVAWGCALFALGAGAFLIIMAIRALGTSAGLAALAAVGVLSLSAGTADARYADLSASSLHNPPLLGVRMEAWLRTVSGR